MQGSVKTRKFSLMFLSQARLQGLTIITKQRESKIPGNRPGAVPRNFILLCSF